MSGTVITISSDDEEDEQPVLHKKSDHSSSHAASSSSTPLIGLAAATKGLTGDATVIGTSSQTIVIEGSNFRISFHEAKKKSKIRTKKKHSGNTSLLASGACSQQQVSLPKSKAEAQSGSKDKMRKNRIPKRDHARKPDDGLTVSSELSVATTHATAVPTTSTCGPKSPSKVQSQGRNRVKDDDIDVREASPSRIALPCAPANWDPDKMRPYGCKYCNGKFLSMTLLRKHMQDHEQALTSTYLPAAQYECPFCSRRFMYHQSRATHLLVKHAGRFVPPVVQAGDNDSKRQPPMSPEKKSPHKKTKAEKVKHEQKSEKTEKMDKDEKVKHGKEKTEKPKSESPKKVEKKADIRVATSSVPVVRPSALMPNRRKPRLNLDFRRDEPTAKECSSCHDLFRDPLTHQFHAPCFEKSPFRLSNGYKCPSCPNSSIVYGSLLNLREHCAVHRVPPFYCSYCGDRKQLLYEMELHVIREHEDRLLST